MEQKPAKLGTLAVTRLCPGVPPQTHTFSLPGDGVGIACVSDALIAADGSLALCGQNVTADQKSGGFLMRLSAEEEVLFALTLEDHPMPAHLTETDTGYAVYADGALLLFDEDGAPLGEAEAGETPLDLTSLNGQAALLTHEGERRAKQAVLHTVESAGRVELPEEDAAPETHATPVPQKGYIALDGEKLICSDGGAGGVTVSLVDAQGRMRFTTRTPIHTAADRLVWESASRTEDGGIRLSGYYETDGADGPSRQRATALLGADGVLAADHERKVHLHNLPARMVNTTGCGDAFMAAIAWAYLQGTDLRGTALAGLAASAIAMEGAGTINPALGVQALKERAGL